MMKKDVSVEDLRLGGIIVALLGFLCMLWVSMVEDIPLIILFPVGMLGIVLFLGGLSITISPKNSKV